MTHEQKIKTEITMELLTELKIWSPSINVISENDVGPTKISMRNPGLQYQEIFSFSDKDKWFVVAIVNDVVMAQSITQTLGLDIKKQTRLKRLGFKIDQAFEEKQDMYEPGQIKLTQSGASVTKVIEFYMLEAYKNIRKQNYQPVEIRDAMVNAVTIMTAYHETMITPHKKTNE